MSQKVLVTGGSGFVAMHLILQLLDQGFDVKATLRSLDKQQTVINTLKANGAHHLDQLSFAEADLSSDTNWQAVMADRDDVFSVASPVFFDQPKNEDDTIKPALEGVQRILTAAQAAGVKRVVMTSNFGAVGFSQKPGQPTTERDWTNPDEPGLSLYEKSKLLAEQAAWAFINRPETTLEFATVNPVAIFGPALSNHVSGSFDLLLNLLSGKMQRIPHLPLNVVDVRDVAALHILAMTTPAANGQRFIASAPGQISMRQIAALIKAKRPALAEKVSTKALPDWLVNLAAPFNAEAKGAKLMRGMNRDVSTAQAENLLGWHSQYDNEQIILNSVDSLAEHHII
ncbi:NAD-dependent epimerase/dehydratase family protein [Lacticaseibacillus brantae]|uniref:NAD-dependent epimerase/dehydratase domain-containing protein n=1 Tax=Lacticaseibacillus brantae DSM 23927 TaxID=1423727 RepID=A0A0R2AZ52_9LACO|nr:NAD-dependent epimerase/dehydratase family protein [Lacticaseibacillus brantae]KRM71810.1 hypothetical protein FC34_GL001471 [Lacticaseibacillus brantae DSM 23927]